MAKGHKGEIKLLIGAGLIGLVTMASGPAPAQDNVTTSLSAVRTCLCAQRAVSIWNERVEIEKERYDQLRGQSNELSRQVEAARGRVNTENRDDIEAFAALLAHRDAAAQSFRDEDQRYSGMVARYNRAVAFSNGSCSGRLFDPEEVESVKSNLVCQRP
ncbi:MAG TPA: hypothetical protein VH020_11870 [Stellaceae bacterium]|nr:hypothetical protein [Stellaceae bacterium]